MRLMTACSACRCGQYELRKDAPVLRHILYCSIPVVGGSCSMASTNLGLQIRVVDRRDDTFTQCCNRMTAVLQESYSDYTRAACPINRV